LNKRNYQKELDKLIERNQKEGKTPRLFLHACCAPCSSYVMEYLSQYFEITIFFYNPNIAPVEEYSHRVAEIRRLIGEMEFVHPVTLMEGRYDPKEFYEMAKGLEDVPEGGERCFRCYRLRMEEAAKLAKEGGYDYFTTTLSISPLKNAQKLNEIGERLAGEYGVAYLVSDFKKRNGYKRSTELSKIYGLYRQDYCGCIYSKNQREREKKLREEEESSVKS
jgi:predicted adenine nucleotide alpha hydrolase (AANH) superfamily ATPase